MGDGINAFGTESRAAIDRRSHSPKIPRESRAPAGWPPGLRQARQRFGFECWHIWLPKCDSIRRSRRGRAETEIWFRIRHAALDGGDGASVASYCEQTVEVTLGPKGAFKKGNVGALTRRVPANPGTRPRSPSERGSPVPG